MPSLACLAACRQRRIWVKNCRSVGYLRKMLNALPKKKKKKHQENTPTGMWASVAAAGAAERVPLPACPPLMISCQLLTQPCNSFRQRLHERQVTPTHTHTHDEVNSLLRESKLRWDESNDCMLQRTLRIRNATNYTRSLCRSRSPAFYKYLSA